MIHKDMTGHCFLLLVLSLVASCAPQEQDGNVTSRVNCTLCPNENSVPLDPTAIFVAGSETLTCEMAHETPRLLTESDCAFWKNRGATICQCSAGHQEDCPLCQDGSALPNPFLQVFPGESCAELQVDARRDEERNCVLHQGIVGTYCGCDNKNVHDDVCRLCNNRTMAFPETIEPTTGLACLQLEFQANLQNDYCSSYSTLYFEACCADAPTPATTISSSMPSTSPTMMVIPTSATCRSHQTNILLVSVSYVLVVSTWLVGM